MLDPPLDPPLFVFARVEDRSRDTQPTLGSAGPERYVEEGLSLDFPHQRKHARSEEQPGELPESQKLPRLSREE